MKKKKKRKKKTKMKFPYSWTCIPWKNISRRKKISAIKIPAIPPLATSSCEGELDQKGGNLDMLGLITSLFFPFFLLLL